MNPSTRRLSLLAALMAVGIVGAGCGDDGSHPQSQVRIVHGSPDAPPVDVYVDGRKVVTNLPYLSDSDYLSVRAGERNLKVNATGTTVTVIDVDATLMARQAYTVLAANYLADIEPLLLEDDRSAPPAGQAKLRVVHGAAGAPAVDVYVTAPNAPLTTPTLTDVPFLGFSDYLTVPAGSYQVRVTLADTTTVVIDTGAVGLAAGDIRTGIAVDAPGGGPPYSILLLQDN
ncbi:MAG: DUF4397 domain-containing protein [Candidatus Binatia bacterium]